MKTIEIDDFNRAEFISNNGRRKYKTYRQDKGQHKGIMGFLESLESGVALIEFDELYDLTSLMFDINEAAMER